MSHISIQYYKSHFGELIIGAYKDELCLCDWRFRKMRNTIDKRIQKGLNAKYLIEDTQVISETIEQLDAYSKSRLKIFDLPLKMVGTDFQIKVWKALQQIHYGETETYSGLAQKLGDKNAVRAVANANGANAIAIIIPCHRIIGSDGKLVGYAGGLPTKKKLLQLENPNQLSLF